MKSRLVSVNGLLTALACMILYMFIFPVAEYNISCPMAATDPDGNETCFIIKDYLWTAVFIMSLGQDGDGFALTEGVDEKYHRNIIPLTYAFIIVLLYQNTKKCKENLN